MRKCLKSYSCKLKKQQCSRRSYLLSTTRWHSDRLAKYFLRYDKMFKTLFLQIEKKILCRRRSAKCWAQRVDTQVDLPNSFWDMRKCLKPYSCKWKIQQCSRRSATCWAQGVDIQVDKANSFWDMKKCLKHIFLQIEETQCSRPSPTCWAQRVDTQVDWANSFWDMTKCLKLLFLQIEETTV